jgi:L-lactate dehydrogenase (cytochrome)
MRAAHRTHSGFRRGTDICKALCMGAAGVAVGRPYLWALGAFGEQGVHRALELLRIELFGIMQQVGAPSIKDLTPRWCGGREIIRGGVSSLGSAAMRLPLPARGER